jgi:molybdopterin synthase catalytic subunit
MAVKISLVPFDPWQVAQDYQNQSVSASFGATTVFVGTMRDFNEGDTVTQMYLDYYPGMTEKQLETIVTNAKEQWCIEEALIMHRVGDILPGQPIVLVAVWSAHRGHAYDASRYIIEALKTKAPFWKKETLASKEQRWVSHNTDGYINH